MTAYRVDENISITVWIFVQWIRSIIQQEGHTFRTMLPCWFVWFATRRPTYHTFYPQNRTFQCLLSRMCSVFTQGQNIWADSHLERQILPSAVPVAWNDSKIERNVLSFLFSAQLRKSFLIQVKWVEFMDPNMTNNRIQHPVSLRKSFKQGKKDGSGMEVTEERSLWWRSSLVYIIDSQQKFRVHALKMTICRR